MKSINIKTSHVRMLTQFWHPQRSEITPEDVQKANQKPTRKNNQTTTKRPAWLPKRSKMAPQIPQATPKGSQKASSKRSFWELEAGSLQDRFRIALGHLFGWFGMDYWSICCIFLYNYWRCSAAACLAGFAQLLPEQAKTCKQILPAKNQCIQNKIESCDF